MVDVTLYQGDALAMMATLEPQSIDAIITDLPYGTTACSWDEVIPFAPMWEAVRRVLKPRGVFVTTASQPFTSALVMSNLEWFKYAWVWEKNHGTGHLNAKIMPMRAHEDVVVFADSGNMYIPQMRMGKSYARLNCSRASTNKGTFGATNDTHSTVNKSGERYPLSVINFDIVEQTDHPTQKPVALYAYLIRTYTNAGDTVLDFCAGSFTTGVACLETGRNFIGIEKEPKYFEIGCERMRKAELQRTLFSCGMTDTDKLDSPNHLPPAQSQMFDTA